ncbi:hypothetical protein ACJW31_07G052500 [Castanea mollissima]
MSHSSHPQAPVDYYPPTGGAYAPKGEIHHQPPPGAADPPLSYPPPQTAYPPVGYPAMNYGPGGYPQQPPPQAYNAPTKHKGDGFWKGCFAALCCCCALDMCFDL